jgi:hypothetical protein|tara:strand:+ start:4226 stop:4396 length:171 start_codon:yes stop_codon:yes gene_type:complete
MGISGTFIRNEDGTRTQIGWPTGKSLKEKAREEREAAEKTLERNDKPTKEKVSKDG